MEPEHFELAVGRPLRDELGFPDFDLTGHNVTLFVKAGDRTDMRVLTLANGLRVDRHSLFVDAHLDLPAGHYLLDILFQDRSTGQIALSAGHTLKIGGAE